MNKQFKSFKYAGRLERDYSVAEKTSSPSKTKMKTVHQRLDIDAKNFPYLHDESIGDECELLVKVKKIAESLPSDYEPDKSQKITIEILSIAEPKTTDEYQDIIAGEEKNMKKG